MALLAAPGMCRLSSGGILDGRCLGFSFGDDAVPSQMLLHLVRRGQGSHVPDPIGSVHLLSKWILCTHDLGEVVGTACSACTHQLPGFSAVLRNAVAHRRVQSS